MLTPRLTNCPECADIPNLLKKIDCKLAEYANGLYNNVVFMLNQVVPAGAMIQLLAYKRILTYKQCNPDYLSDFCMDKIVSKVIRLTLDCYIKPTVTETLIPATTSTTSTSTTCPPLNCSFDGTGVSSCSFTGTVNKVTTIPATTTTTTTSITPTTTSTSTSTTTTTTNTPTTTTTTTETPTTTTTTTTAAPFNPEIILSWTVSGNAADACALYGDPGSEVTYYADDIWFIAYGLFQDPAMTIPAPASMYSDGNYSRYWNGSEFTGSPVPC